MIPPINHQDLIVRVESLSRQLPIDSSSYQRIKQIVGEFIKGINPALKHPSYQRIARTLAQNSVQNIKMSEDIIWQNVSNFLQGMRFLSNTYAKQKEYLTLGEMYGNQEIDKAESYAKEHALNPTYAHSYIPRPDGTLALVTALGKASYQGDIEVVQRLTPRVDTNFAVYHHTQNVDSQFSLPHEMVLISQVITSVKKIQMFQIIKKQGINPFQRNLEGWSISGCLSVPLNHKKPEVLHTLLEAAKDFTAASRTYNNKSESILDNMLGGIQLETLKYISKEYLQKFQESLMENAIVMISYGIPLNVSVDVKNLPPLQVKNSAITLQVALKVFNEEKGKLDKNQKILKENLSGALSIPLSPEPLIDLVISYSIITERSMRILTARSCFKRIFGYSPNPVS